MKRLTLLSILGCLLSALLCLPLTATAKAATNPSPPDTETLWC